MKNRKIFIGMFVFLLLLGVAGCSGERSSSENIFSAGQYFVVLPESLEGRSVPSNSSGSSNMDSDGIFYKGDSEAGGITLHILPDDMSLHKQIFFEPMSSSKTERETFTLRETFDFSPLYPSEVVEADLSKLDTLCPSYAASLTMKDGSEQTRFYYVASNYHIYDLWFDLNFLSEEEAYKAAQSLFFGTNRADSPDGKHAVSFYDSGMEHLAYFWDLTGENPVMTESMPASGLLPDGVPDSPLWSPDSQKLAVGISNENIRSFTFLTGARPTGFHTGAGDLMKVFTDSGYSFDYELAADPEAELVPLEWGKDSESLKFSYAWMDSTGVRRSGTAWYSLADPRAPIKDIDEDPIQK